MERANGIGISSNNSSSSSLTLHHGMQHYEHCRMARKKMKKWSYNMWSRHVKYVCITSGINMSGMYLRDERWRPCCCCCCCCTAAAGAVGVFVLLTTVGAPPCNWRKMSPVVHYVRSSACMYVWVCTRVSAGVEPSVLKCHYGWPRPSISYEYIYTRSTTCVCVLCTFFVCISRPKKKMSQLWGSILTRAIF